jgi:hypothetical protein
MVKLVTQSTIPPFNYLTYLQIFICFVILSRAKDLKSNFTQKLDVNNKYMTFLCPHLEGVGGGSSKQQPRFYPTLKSYLTVEVLAALPLKVLSKKVTRPSFPMNKRVVERVP